MACWWPRQGCGGSPAGSDLHACYVWVVVSTARIFEIVLSAVCTDTKVVLVVVIVVVVVVETRSKK